MGLRNRHANIRQNGGQKTSWYRQIHVKIAQKSWWCSLFSSISVVSCISNSFQRDRWSLKNTIQPYWRICVRKSVRKSQIHRKIICGFYTTIKCHLIERQLWPNVKPKTQQIVNLDGGDYEPLRCLQWQVYDVFLVFIAGK